MTMTKKKKKKKNNSIPTRDPKWRVFGQGEVAVVKTAQKSTVFLQGHGSVVDGATRKRDGASIMKPHRSIRKDSDSWKWCRAIGLDEDIAENELDPCLHYDAEDYACHLLTPFSGEPLESRVALLVYDDFSVTEVPYDEWKHFINYEKESQWKYIEHTKVGKKELVLYYMKSSRNSNFHETPVKIRIKNSVEYGENWKLYGDPGWQGHGNFADTEHRFHILVPSESCDHSYAWKFNEDESVEKIEKGFRCKELDTNGRDMVFDGRTLQLFKAPKSKN